MLDDKTKARIAKDAVAHYRQATAETNSYIAGAEAESERSSVLIEALEDADDTLDDIIAADPLNVAAKQSKKRIAEALSQYNKH